MPIAKPPVSPDVADVIGAYAEKVENRSLLLDKFIIHKSWPEDDVLRRKLDDAVRWSFIRCAENGEAILAAERQRNFSVQNGRNTDKRRDAERKIEILDRLKPCACRKLAQPIEVMREAHVKRLVALIEKASFGHRVLVGRLESRMAVNLSGSLVQNAGICLDRLFGVPYLPGSAVKGVCRHVALEDLRAGTLSLADFQTAFGSAEADFKPGGELADFRQRAQKEGLSFDQKGCIDFLAAYPQNAARLMVDLTNVHFPDYYKTGVEADLSHETPRPNPFPVVEAGAEFAFCIAVNSMGGRFPEARKKAVLDLAEDWLHRAMEVSGFGAKTAAGYGWFSDLTPELNRQRELEAAERAERERIAAEDEQRKQKEAARRQSLSPEEREAEDKEKSYQDLKSKSDEEFHAFATALGEKSRPEILAFCQLLKKEKKERWKTWKKKKSDLAAYICETAKTVGVDLS